MCICRSVTSAPYSLSKTSRWHGYRVCDVRVAIEGPHHRLQDVQKSLGTLKDFTTTTDASDSTYENCYSDDNADTNNYILIDSDSDSSTSTQPLSDTTVEITNTLTTPPLKRKHDSDSDITPSVTPPFKTYRQSHIQTPLFQTSTDKQDDCDTTPTVTPPPTRKVTIIYRQRPKKLF